MSTKLFYILKGNNGATYIFNVSSWENSCHSLKFYKSLTIRSKFLKGGLHLYLWLVSFFKWSKLLTLEGLNAFLANKFGKEVTFGITNHCSVLISPTRDKVIVNHHEQFFQKFAFGQSYNQVKNEVQTYELQQATKLYIVATISAIIDNGTDYCSFMLTNPTSYKKRKKPIGVKELTEILVEFFTKTNLKKVVVKTYLNEFRDRLEKDPEINKCQLEQLHSIVESDGDKDLKLGLVHKDFKPWNVLQSNPLLIYDFEEAQLHGLPLEDLFNYYIDPIIRYSKPKLVLKKVLAETPVEAYKSYLKSLAIDVAYIHLLHFYLMERMLFWKSRGDSGTSKAFRNVSNELIKRDKH